MLDGCADGHAQGLVSGWGEPLGLISTLMGARMRPERGYRFSDDRQSDLQLHEPRRRRRGVRPCSPRLRRRRLDALLKSTGDTEVFMPVEVAEAVATALTDAASSASQRAGVARSTGADFPALEELVLAAEDRRDGVVGEDVHDRLGEERRDRSTVMLLGLRDRVDRHRVGDDDARRCPASLAARSPSAESSACVTNTQTSRGAVLLERLGAGDQRAAGRRDVVADDRDLAAHAAGDLGDRRRRRAPAASCA